jgi:hypothetical protein
VNVKTTVEIPDPLFRAARKHCAEHGISFRELIEAGLRQAIDRKPPASIFRMKPFGFRGEAQLEQDWGAIREMIYQGRGGSKEAGGQSK